MGEIGCDIGVFEKIFLNIVKDPYVQENMHWRDELCLAF